MKLKTSSGFSNLLFVPGTRPDRFGKALASGADLVCIDLEDSVPPGEKDAAREAALRAIADDASFAIRINGLATEAGLRDLLAIKSVDRLPSLLFLPMVDGPSHVRIAQALLAPDADCLVPLVETREALAATAAIVAEPGVAAIMFGGGDLAAELGVALAWEPLLAARGQFLLGAGGRGIGVIDVPFVDLGDGEGLEEEARRARALGFTAKAAIHPSQIDSIRRAFAPTEREIEEAGEAIAAFRAGGGRAVRHNGRMLEAPLVRRYEGVLAKVEKEQDA